jgi:predicted HNH restriction endonuclease
MKAGCLKRAKWKYRQMIRNWNFYEDEQKESLEKHLMRERDTIFRNKYRDLNRYILNCSTCGLMAKNVFGLNQSNSFLELHRIEPLKNKKGSSKKTSKEATLLCPNCHKAIHRMMIANKEATIKIEELKKDFILNC